MKCNFSLCFLVTIQKCQGSSSSFQCTRFKRPTKGDALAAEDTFTNSTQHSITPNHITEQILSGLIITCVFLPPSFPSRYLCQKMIAIVTVNGMSSPFLLSSANGPFLQQSIKFRWISAHYYLTKFQQSIKFRGISAHYYLTKSFRNDNPEKTYSSTHKIKSQLNRLIVELVEIWLLHCNCNLFNITELVKICPAVKFAKWHQKKRIFSARCYKRFFIINIEIVMLFKQLTLQFDWVNGRNEMFKHESMRFCRFMKQRLQNCLSYTLSGSKTR